MRSNGSITRRGKSSWRLKFDLGRDPITGKRLTRFMTVRGKRQDAQRELTRVLNAFHDGTLVEPSRVTVAQYMRSWLDNAHQLSPKTAERFKQLIEQQIIPHLGGIALQKLKPIQVANWHSTILKGGGKDGRPLSAATVRQAQRILHLAFAHAVKTEVLARNVASGIKPPKVEKKEIECLKGEQMGLILTALSDHPLYPIVVLALGTGMRRGELLALRWCDIDFESGSVKVERSIEQTKAGLRFKLPKTAYGRRTISLPASAIEALKAHRKQQLEQRLALGQGRPPQDALVFCNIDGAPLSPVRVSGSWRDVVKARKLPTVSFHALRHSHASTLIASGVDVVTVSRRLGHASPVVTLSVYAHLVRNNDQAVTDAIDAALRTTTEQGKVGDR